MPIDSAKFFDSIRVKPRQTARQQTRTRETAVMCEWPDCKNKGPHRAPKGRENSREYWHFCLDHVREYNQSYNFFDGMSAEAVERFRKDAITGHRPTWKLGLSLGSRFKRLNMKSFFSEGAADPFTVRQELGGGRAHSDARRGQEFRVIDSKR